MSTNGGMTYANGLKPGLENPTLIPQARCAEPYLSASNRTNTK